MSRIGGAAYRAGAIAGAIALTAGLAAPAAAQADNTERALQTTASNNPQGTRKPVKPNDAAKRTGAPQAVRSGNADAWTINQALPEAPKTVRSNPAPAPEPVGSQFGRLQLETGSVGFETQTQFKDNKFSDGRTVPGLETQKRDGTSYFGLSLSLPTTGNTLIPAPIAPRRE